MFEQVPAAEMDVLAREVFGGPLAELAFEEVASRKWVRSAKAPIREIVQLGRGRGGMLVPKWGYSIDFVPHVASGKVRWHRTAKGAVFDLCYDPWDYELIKLTDRRWVIPAMLGLAESRAAATKVQAEVMAESARFFDSVQTIADLPAAFEAKRQRPYLRFGLLNYVQEPLAYAFTLAALGRLTDASEWLATAERSHRLGASESQKLHRFFDELLCQREKPGPD
jgi:hypothetical protein